MKTVTQKRQLVLMTPSLYFTLSTNSFSCFTNIALLHFMNPSLYCIFFLHTPPEAIVPPANLFKPNFLLLYTFLSVASSTNVGNKKNKTKQAFLTSLSYHSPPNLCFSLHVSLIGTLKLVLFRPQSHPLTTSTAEIRSALTTLIAAGGTLPSAISGQDGTKESKPERRITAHYSAGL